MTVAAFIDRSKREKENWKYTDLERLMNASFPRKRESSASDSEHVSPTTVQFKNAEVISAQTRLKLDSRFRGNDEEKNDHARIYFLNGTWQPQLSHFGTVPSCILMGDLESGYKLTLGEHTCLVAQPIELFFLADENAPPEINIKFSIDIGEHGRLTLLTHHMSSSAITTLETDITLHAHAKFVYGKIMHDGAHLAMNEVHLARGAYFDNFTLLLGGHPIRHETNVWLEGEGAHASLNGATLLRAHQHADTTTRITHQAANCTSRQIHRTVLDDQSRGVFQGKIAVAKDAQKSDGFQLSRALLLSDSAEMDAKPELEIYADDVKCSHGSTIGDLDDNAMFYLRARGLSEAEARALLIQAFAAEMIDDIHIDDWWEIFRREIEGWAQ